MRIDDRNQARALYKRVLSLVASDPILENAFNKLRNDSKKLTRPVSVDLTSRCNLFCEGCYYFEGDNNALHDENEDDKWLSFFEKQNKTRTKFCYLGGAEPALHPERLRHAANNIPYGIIAANGTIKIDHSIPYRIAVSVWGNEESTGRLRGGKTFWKAIRNFGKDPRAFFVYTVSSENIDQIREVAEAMRDTGAKLTFNMYSPTTRYLSKLEDNSDNDNLFFRTSSQEDNLCFSPEDLIHCRETITQIIDDFPETVVYPHSFNREVTQNESLYKLDPKTGFAMNCAGRHNGTHETYLSTLEKSTQKCCMPNMDCVTCKALAAYLPSRLMPRFQDVASKENLKDWLEICHYWAWFYLGEEWRPLDL